MSIRSDDDEHPERSLALKSPLDSVFQASFLITPIVSSMFVPLLESTPSFPKLYPFKDH